MKRKKITWIRKSHKGERSLRVVIPKEVAAYLHITPESVMVWEFVEGRRYLRIWKLEK